MSKLPEQFSELESLWGDWIIDNEPERVKRREAVSTEQLQAFYEDMLPQTEDILAYLDAFPINDLPERERKLWWLMASFAGAGMTVELYGTQEAIPGSYILSEVRPLQKYDSLELFK